MCAIVCLFKLACVHDCGRDGLGCEGVCVCMSVVLLSLQKTEREREIATLILTSTAKKWPNLVELLTLSSARE